MINTYAYIHAYGNIDERITDACLPRRRAHVRVHVCARARLCVCVWPHISVKHVRALSVGAESLRFGLQAFYKATAFNANIGAWNTAAVTSLSAVCAAFGRQRATAADALGRTSMQHGRVRGSTADVRARGVCVHTYRCCMASIYTCVRLRVLTMLLLTHVRACVSA